MVNCPAMTLPRTDQSHQRPTPAETVAAAAAASPPAARRRLPMPPLFPEEILQWNRPEAINQVQVRWQAPNAKQPQAQLILRQRREGQSLHPDRSLCFRPEICPQSSKPAIAWAAAWLIERGWQLARKPGITPQGYRIFRLYPPDPDAS